MESTWMKRLWTHIGAPAIALFLGLSIGPFWQGDLSYRYRGAEDYFEAGSLWRALATVPRNAAVEGTGDAVRVFYRKNTAATAVLFGFCTAVSLLRYPFIRHVKCTGREYVVSNFVVGLVLVGIIYFLMQGVP